MYLQVDNALFTVNYQMSCIEEIIFDFVLE